MKSFKDLSMNLPEQEYHDYPAWSYSIIAKYAKEGFGALATLHEKTIPTPSMEFGSLFDSIITKGKKTLDEYAVYSRTIPAAEKNVIDSLVKLNTGAKLFSEFSDEVMTKVMEDCQYYTRWSFDTKMKHLIEYADYLEIAASGKKLVSQTDWSDAMEMARIFRTDPYLKTLFGIKNSANVEYLYQKQYTINYTLDSGKEVTLKIMPDLMKIDHSNKTIQLVDLKTSSIPAWNFKENFIKFRYDIQAHLYSDCISRLVKNTELQDYTILPYLFTDISRSDKVPVTYLYDQTDISQSNGFTYTMHDKTYTYKHWTTLLEEILSYEEVSAKVPNYINVDKPNDLLSIISNS